MRSLLTSLFLRDAVEKYSDDQPRDESGKWTAGGGDAERHGVLERHGFKPKDQFVGAFGGSREAVGTTYAHPDGRVVQTFSNKEGTQHHWSQWRNSKTTVMAGRGYTAAQLDAHLQTSHGKESGASDKYHWGRKVPKK